MQQIFRMKGRREAPDALELGGWVAAGLVGVLVLAIVVFGLVTPASRSFLDWHGAPTGLQNYVKLFSNHDFMMTWQNTLWDLLVVGVGGLLLSAGIALTLCTLRRPLRYAALAALFMPLCCPGVWQQFNLVFTRDPNGLVNGLLLQWGLINEPILFAYSVWTAPLVRLTQLWRSLGPGVLILMAGLDGVRPGAYRESRQRGITTRSAAARDILLPRMRVPLMLAAAVMVMGAMGTSEVARRLAIIMAGVTPLWGYVMDQYRALSEGFASAAAVVTQLFTLGVFVLLCGGIFLLTRRPERDRLAGTQAPAEGAGLPHEPDGWRHPMRIAGVVVMTLICLMAGILLFLLINRAFMPLDEIYQYPPKIIVRKPTLESFSDLAVIMEDSELHPWKNFGKALLYAIPLGALGIAIGWLAGHALSCRKVRALRWGLIICLLLVMLCTPMVEQAGRQLGFDEEAAGMMRSEEVLYVIMWILTPVSVMLGLSMRWLLRGDAHLALRRVMTVAVGCAAMILLLCWRGTVGEAYAYMNSASVSRVGAGAAGTLLDTLIGLITGVPILLGLYQLCSGAGETFPLYQGEIT